MTTPLPGTAKQLSADGLRPDARPVWLVIGPALAASVGAFLLAVTVGPALTAIQRALGLPASAKLWIFVAYLLPAVLAVLAGTLVGRRWPTAVTLSAITLLVLGTLLTAFAPGSGSLLLGRAVTGFGAGLAWGTTAVLVAQMGARRVWVAPLVGGVVGLALCLGPVAGTLLAQTANWRLPFVLVVPVEMVALLATAVSGIVVLIRRASPPAQPPTAPSAMKPS
ncbi:MFS transporter [Micromonospora peucetia]|uniref:MFS transporter n=1 Tax=Micromonospora peucetia TaxID=47871 RepID=A0A1C6UJQ7_9ACTN|nr:MFS transporter [Micromonospora peucetia]WSA34186.1 MFS transporter [Micromonospora peucetia]SCL54184.1 Major Facilitator Superfamily protein [Micromonospora peucetia]